MYIKYGDFKGSLNENVQQAKVYLKNRALKMKKDSYIERNPEATPEELKSVGLNPNEVRSAEQNPEFLKIKDLVKDSPAYTYVFTKFYFEDLSGIEPNQRIEDLKNLYNTLKDLRQSLGSLPMPVDRYTTQKPTPEDPRGPYERLVDDLEKLKGGKKTNNWINQLLSWQKVWFENLTPVQKEKIDGIAAAFDEFGMDPDGTKDMKKNKDLQDYFFIKVKKYRTIGELLQGAENYVKSASNAGASKFLQAIAKVNNKYGEINGAEEVYNENNILIIEVRSFVANRDLNANTSHCIASSQGNWDSYVGDEKFTKQYYIYNFNLSPSDTKSVIGITIGEGGKITACHKKDDGNFMGEITSYMKKIGVPMSVLAPMTPDEITKKKKRMAANKLIIKENITLDKVKEYFQDGADVNAGGGKPLLNAVKEDDYERAKFLLDMNANPNLGESKGGIIKFSKNLDMIKLLVSYGAEITSDIFKGILNDTDAVEFVLKSGADPNFERGLPLRTAAKEDNEEVYKLLIKYGANISERSYMAIKWAAQYGKVSILKLLFQKLKQIGDQNFKDPKFIERFLYDDQGLMNWVETSDNLDENKRKEIIEVIEDSIKSFK